MATNTLILRSRDRADGESHKFRITLAHPMQGCWTLEAASIPNSQHQITAANNELLLVKGTATQSIHLPEGYYSHLGLVDALNTALQYEGITAAYAAQTNTLTFTSGSTHFTFDPIQSIGPVIGFTQATPQAGTLVGEPMDLVGPTLCYHVVLDASGCDYPVSDAAGRHATFWIPCNEDSLTHCEYKSGDFRAAQVASFRTPCRELSVRLVDAEHQTVVFCGQEWYMVLRRT